MGINAIEAGYQNQIKLIKTSNGKEAQAPAAPSAVSKLNTEIKQAEAEMKETMKQAQKAAAKSVGGKSEEAQLLQGKILLQQQEIMTKQLQIKEIESPKTTEQVSSAIDEKPRFDRYVPKQANTKAVDNVYSLKQKDGNRQIVFNRG